MISIIVPAYNEEKAIEEVLKKLTAAKISGEIIVVDDGSTDNTLNIARSFPVRIIHQEINRGNGSAIKTGIRAAKYDAIAIFDADDTFFIEDFLRMIPYINEYDMVVGARISKDAFIPPMRRPAKWFIKKLASFLADYKIPDINSGLRIVKKEHLERFFSLFPNGFSFHTTITLALLCNDYNVKFLPVSCKKSTGKSKIKPIQDTYNFIQLIIRVVMYFRPLKVFLPISLLLFVAGLVVLVYEIFIITNITETVLIIFNMAFFLLLIGLLADLINKRLPIK